jgi:uncharacterized protein (DUF1015 family)
MPTLDPVACGLVPVDSAAAATLGAPNYDEFQGDGEAWESLQARPHSVLRVTMPHCDVADVSAIGEDGSEASLAHARVAMQQLVSGRLTRKIRDLLWVYEITRAERASAPQIGLGGMALTREIRTPQNPGGSIIRNEGIRESKARGRARLTEATRADMGTVNLAIDDATGRFQAALEDHARANAPSYEATDELGGRHRVWLVNEPAAGARLRALVAAEPRAYVADGNHRSAAAALLGYPHFLAVCFAARAMTIAPYNRLVEASAVPADDLIARLRGSFIIDPQSGGAYQPERPHDIGLYDGSGWWRLRPRPGTFDPRDAAQDIDADIVQRRIFADVLNVTDAGDERLAFIGANRDARWLQNEVDSGRFRLAVTLPPVTMRQFTDVCMQDKFMPPKSTWFVPKIRSGLVMALLD